MCVSFYQLLYGLEDEGILDPSDNIDLFALHFVYIPRINQQLETFCRTYSHHRLRSEGNRTPYQLWIEGMARLDTDTHAVQGAEMWNVSYTCICSVYCTENLQSTMLL